MSIASPKRILIIKLRHHGDVLLTTPVIDAVKTRFPDCETDMLVYHGTDALIRENHAVSRIFTIDRNWKKQGIKAQWQHETGLFKQLRQRNYDWVFNLSDQWRAALIAKLCGRCSVGMDVPKRDNFLWRFCHDFLNPESGTDTHIVHQHLSILPPLLTAEESRNARVLLDISDASRRSFLQKLTAQGWAGEDYILMHPGARWVFKCWEDGKTAALAQLLLNHGQNIVLTAAPDPAEQQIIQAVTQRLHPDSKGRVWTLSGQLELPELAAAIERAKLFIGVDSAPMHIAAALDKPQVALFGPSWVEKWRPYSDAAQVIWAGDYGELPHPDSIDTATSERMLKAISVETVWNAVADKLIHLAEPQTDGGHAAD